MKKYMPLNGLRWSRDSGFTLCDTPQNGRSRTGWGGGHWAEAAANAVGHDYDLDVVVIMHYIVIFTFESP